MLPKEILSVKMDLNNSYWKIALQMSKKGRHNGQVFENLDQAWQTLSVRDWIIHILGGLSLCRNHSVSTSHVGTAEFKS